ncbi:MAG TPA: ABC transporter six-transmembrane domain-containing protein [Acidobacteriota bacterium]|nr:ABC transporter six-transmembrane domain-containing protein [Acidobacteriota bacterium]
MALKDVIRRYRPAFVFAISLVVIEKLAWIVEPTLFGRLLDRLIDAFGAKEHISYTVPLVLWIGVFAINSGVGAARRSIDERIYLKMFTNMAVDVTEVSREKGLSVAKTASRVELSRDYVAFLKRRVPDFIEEAFDLGGTAIALALYDWRISLTCLLIVFPTALISRLYSRKVGRLEKKLHDMREDVFDVFATKDTRQVRAYYEAMGRPQKKIADWGAVNFGLIRLFLLGIFVVVLFIAIDIDDFSTGKIYSVVAYLWTFVTSTEYLPDLLESYASAKDIQNRARRESPTDIAPDGI